MSDRRFDDFARELAQAPASRRGFLSTLTRAVAGLFVLAAGGQRAAAQGVSDCVRFCGQLAPALRGQCVSDAMLGRGQCYQCGPRATGNLYLSPATGTCEASCPSGYAPNDTTRCCVLSTPTCSPGQYEYNGDCYTTCPDGTYGDAGSGTCGACASACATCSAAGSSSCTSCADPAFLSNGQCVASCPAGTYGESNVCQPCSSSCATCSGGAANQCTSCTPPNVLTNGACTPPPSCPPNCATCSGATCTSCNTGYWLHQGGCVAPCPNKFYPAANGTCGACFTTCATCTGPLSTHCLTCNCTVATGKRYLSGGSCVTNCGALGVNNNTCTCGA